MPVWAIIGIAVAATLIAWVLASLHTRRKDIKKVAYMMDALEDGELNFRFQDRNKFNRTLNRIRDHLREAAAGPRAGFLDQTHPGADPRNHEHGVADRLPVRRDGAVRR